MFDMSFEGAVLVLTDADPLYSHLCDQDRNPGCGV